MLQSYAHKLILLAVEKNASDLHLELHQDIFSIRYRIASELILHETTSSHLGLSLIRFFKTAAKLSNASPDGQLSLTLNNSPIEMRLNLISTPSTQSLVIRFLSNSKKYFSLDSLGLPPDLHQILVNALSQPQGLILLSGPTGSGKTTSLYAMLQYLSSKNLRILTIEDPVELVLKKTIQVQVNQTKNITFETALRAFLRHDPDVIMIGEIRDELTASIAFKAALSGHLVLSCVHASTPQSTLLRLLNLNIPKSSLLNALLLIISQSLEPNAQTKALNPHFSWLHQSLIPQSLPHPYMANV